VAVAAVVVLVALAVAVPVMLPGGGPGHRAITSNGVGVIDLQTGRITAASGLGARPGQIAVGNGAAWVTNEDEDTVFRLDAKTRALVQRIDVGRDPVGVAVSPGAVWVANAGSREVSWINPSTNRVVQTIPVGNGPTGVALGEGSLWVTNSLDDTVARIDPERGRVLGFVPVGGTPTAVTTGFGWVWVANATEGTISRIDPSSDRVTGVFPVGSGPRAIAVAKGQLWVSNNLAGTVSRVDPSSGAVTATAKVGAGPGAIVSAGGSLWVAAENGGTIGRIDPGTATVEPIATRGAPTTHRGGTLSLVAPDSGFVDTIDPASFGSTSPLLTYVYDGLVGYKRVGGVDGSTLVPDLATSVPAPTDGGRTYTFQLRPGLTYADGTPVRASDVRASMERAISFGHSPILGSVVGAAGCVHAPPGSCSLARGILTDDATRTVTFRLSGPDPDFLFQLAGPGAQVVAAATPRHEVGTDPIPGTGPYVIADFVPRKRLELARNERFHAWSVAQPAGYPDRIVLTGGLAVDDAVRAVEDGKADYYFGQPPASMLDGIATRYTQQAHFYPYRGAWALYLNTKVPPFDDVRVRRALAFAVDRNRVARRYPARSVVTCQMLVPNFPGYQPYCPYTVNSGPTGTWTAPDLTAARSLVARSHTEGTPVTLWSYREFEAPSEYVGSVLRDLGYPTTVKVIGGRDFFAFYRYVADTRNRAQAAGYWSVAPDPSSSEMVDPLTCRAIVRNDGTGANTNTAQFCDPPLDGLVARARAEQATDPAAAAALWTRVDRMLVDEAPLVPMVIPQALDLVSARVRNYQNNPSWGMVFDQIWLK
jgi:YVTN family beta-propeller protein